MKTLFLVELRRFTARRLFRWLTVIVLLCGAFAGTAAFLGSSNSEVEVAQFEAQQDARLTSCVTQVRNGTWGGGETLPAEALSDPQQFCEDETWAEDPRFRYEEMTWLFVMLALPLALLACLIGASFMGAEWQSRGITTSLTWEPRRARVLGAKFLVAVSVTFVWVVLLQLAFAALMYPAAALRGTMAGVDSAWWSDAGEGILRVGVVGSLSAMFGMALATIGRNTAAAFGAGFAYIVIVEGLIRGLKPAWDDWLVGDNFAMFMIGPEDVTNVAHSQVVAGLLVLGYALALGWVALMIFRKREIA